jgi:hypothetical protein
MAAGGVIWVRPEREVQTRLDMSLGVSQATRAEPVHIEGGSSRVLGVPP